MRVAQVMAGAPIGGAESFYARMVAALANYPQLDQRAFTRTNPQRESILTQAGVPVSTFCFGGPLQFFNNRQYVKALKEWHADIVVTYMNRATKLTPAGNYKLVARLGHYYNLKNYRHCDYWVGITKGICNHLIKGGMPAERVVQIPNFVDETIADPLPRTSFETPDNTPILFALGRLHVNKAFDVLFKALPAIPNSVVWLAGDGPEKESLTELCEELKITDRVRFLGWRTDVNALMKTADILVCPSRHEGFGSIVPEAWFNGCPIIATNSQGPGELIEDGETGLVTPVDNVDALADGINQLLGDSQPAQEMAQTAYKHYQDNYSREKICARYLEFFSSIN
jgi:glycosyltransferase involved in cell wall biosynthesis